MNITFLGAAREVTGSNFLLETESGKKILVDCGLIQGKKAEEEKNKDPFLYDPKDIDYVLLTHAHIDHSGRIPKLYNEGFRGKIYCTKATKELCEIMLPDSGHIQETETEWLNRKRGRQNKKLIEPLYTKEDAEKCLEVFEEIEYDRIFEIEEGVSVRFNDAGHMLGSAIIEVWVTEHGVTNKTVFTGDLGTGDNSLLDNPSIIKRADYLVMESTYGNRLHPQTENRGKKFLDIVSKTLKRGGTVVIPSFAVGRTQEIVFELDRLKEQYKDDLEFQEEFKEVMNAKVYIDSPLATFATEVFKNNLDLFDDEIQKQIEKGDNPLDFPGLKFTQSVDDSKALNENREPKIIISASGMCDAGRIKHHLKHNIWDSNNTILFVGYQAPGTLGRRIVEGAKRIKIFGEEVAVNAEIEFIEGYSGHADRDGLLDFVGGFTEKPKSIFLVHGDIESQTELKRKIQEKYDAEIYIPRFGSSYELTEIVRSSRKVRHLALKDIRDEKLKFVDTMDNLGASLNNTLSKLRDYIVADKMFTEDANIWNKEEEHLQKLYKLSNAFNQEVKFLLDNKIERKTREEDLEEPYTVPDFGRKKHLLEEKNPEKVVVQSNKKDIESKPITIKGTNEDPVRLKLQEIKRKTRNLEGTEKLNKEKNIIKEVLPKEQEQKINILPNKNEEIKINAKIEDKKEDSLTKAEQDELDRLDKELELEISKEKNMSIELETIEDLMKEVEEANKKLEREKEELKQLKVTRIDQEEKLSKDIEENKSKLKKEEVTPKVEENVEQAKEDKIGVKEENENKNSEQITKASKVIKELSDEIKKLDNNPDDELVIGKIFDKIAEIEKLDELSDDDIKKIKEEIAKMEDKINNG